MEAPKTDAQRLAELEATVQELTAKLAVTQGAPAGGVTGALNSFLVMLGQPDSLLMSAIRNGLLSSGALLGYIGLSANGAQWEQVVSSIMVIAGAAWVWFRIRLTKKAQQVALHLDATTPTETLKAVAAIVPSGAVTAANVATALEQVKARQG